jgi:DNA polymerase I
MNILQDFPEIWVVDYEFHHITKGMGNHGENPIPICYCAKELISNKEVRQWIDLDSFTTPDYMKNENALFIAYASVAEMSCHVVLNLPCPPFMIDLFTEFLNLYNGKHKIGTGLLDACNHYDIVGGDEKYKTDMRDRILENPPYSYDEKKDILHYCFKDVDLTGKLFKAMIEKIDIPHALLRGRYTYSVAKIENKGIPINMDAFNLIKTKGEEIKEKLVRKLDKHYNVYDETKFNNEKFLNYLNENKIPWDLTPKSNLPIMRQDYLEDKVKSYPQLRPLFELRKAMGQTRLIGITVGPDGRNRSAIMPNITITERNRPSSTGYIFGAPAWQRHLIKPEKGMALAYIDYEQEEFAIAGALSNDTKMMEDYKGTDPYLEFAKRADAVPENATKESHTDIRNQYKQCVLAIGYGAGIQRIASQANVSLLEAESMLSHHKNIYNKFWSWNTLFSDIGKMSGDVHTNLGWKMSTLRTKPTTLQNWAMQAHGSELLRLATCYGTESGIDICALVHDAILIEAPIERIDEDVKKMQEIMKQASIELFDFEIFTDVKILRYPEHYVDERNSLMYKMVCELVGYDDKA